MFEWFNQKNICTAHVLCGFIVFMLFFILFSAIIVNLYNMPDKYVLSSEFFDIDGRPTPIPIELYTKKTRENTSLTDPVPFSPFGEKGGDEEEGKKKKKKKKKVNKHEDECRRILEKIFNKKFPSRRHDIPWLINPITGSHLELDMYCEELKLAVEYDGRQHVEMVPMFHKNEIQASYQRTKDRLKDKLCKKHKVELIRIPHRIKFDNLEEYITEELTKRGRILDTS